MKLRALLYFPVLTSWLLAQDTGTILGKITDASGAVIPGATVELTNVHTNLNSRTSTNELGDYVFTLVRIGNYSIRVEHQGFRTAVRPNLILNVQHTMRVDISMQIGGVIEILEIMAESPLLESVTSSSGQVVRNKEIVDLPLNGRDYQQLAVLTAGTIPTRGTSRGTGDFSASGARPVNNNYLLDGVDNNSYIVDLQGGTSQVAAPSVDAIQEFKVQKNNFSAEFGRYGGAVLNVSIKSGTNEYHGSAFEFLRNSALDANAFFNNRSNRKLPPFRQNQFGGTFGGPVRRNKLFFFASYQGTRISQGDNQVSTVPSVSEKIGLFTRAIYDPDTTRVNPSGSGYVRDPFPGNQIPAARFDPVGKRLGDVYPDPNLSGAANNFILNPAIKGTVDQYDGRFDWSVSSKDSVFGRYSYVNDDRTTEGALPAPAVGQIGSYNRPVIGHSAVLNETHVFSPATINEFRLGFNRHDTQRLPQVKDRIIEQFGFRGIPFYSDITGLPSISVTGLTSLGENGTLPNLKVSQSIQILESVSYNRGSHSFKAGADIRFIVSNAFTPSGTRGSFGFSGIFTQDPQRRSTTGSALADLLLGVPGSASVTTPTDADLRQRYYGFYFQDDWRVNNRLTMNFGIRWDLNSPFWERYNRWANFISNSASPDFNKIVVAGSRGDSIEDRALVPFSKKDFAPRLGLAYRLTDKVVVRTAYGIFNSGTMLIGINGTPAFNPPNTASYSTSTDQLFPNFFLQTGFPVGALKMTVDQINRSVMSYNFGRNGYLQQWSFGVQNEFLPNMLADVTYTGTVGHKLGGSRSISQPRPGPGPQQPRSPFPQYTSLSSYESVYNSAYHGLAAKLERRFSGGLSFLVAYTWSHFIDNTVTILDLYGAGAQDAENLAGERGNSGYDGRHRLVSSYTYDIPVGKGRSFSVDNPVLNTVIGGWQLNGILARQSGRPFTPTSSVNTCNCGGASRPDRIGSGVLPSGERRVERWFDVNAFVIPTGFVFGNSGRNILAGPSLFAWDFSLFKNFQVSERLRVQFRFESFNFTNHTNFGLPGTAIGTSSAGTLSSTLTDARQNQFGLKVMF
jgi:hypothetical protein